MMKEELDKALEALKSGKTLLYPTDTIWGIGCDAKNAEAIDKIYQIKERDPSKSMIILIAEDHHLERYIKEVPEVAWEIIDAAEKPLTIVYPNAMYLPDNLTAKDGSIAIRIVKDEFCKKLIQRLKSPLVSTSANLAGEPSPGSFEDISPEILKRVDHVVNLPASKTGNQSSSIIKLEVNGEITVIRK